MSTWQELCPTCKHDDPRYRTPWKWVECELHGRVRCKAVEEGHEPCEACADYVFERGHNGKRYERG